MGKKCLKCGHERQASDMSPDYECPNCGAIYAKAESALSVKQLSKGESMTMGEDPIEWRAIRLLAIITAFYTAVFAFKLGGGGPDTITETLVRLLLTPVVLALMYSPFWLLIRFGMANKENPSALRVVFVAMLINSVGGFFMSYEASIVLKTDVGGALMFAVLWTFQLVISTIGIMVAKGLAKRP